LIGGFPIKAAQIALPLSFDRQFSFDNYFSQQGELIIANLKALITAKGESMIGLWGKSDSGKTHLINACAHFSRQRGTSFQLYDGSELAQCDADSFENLATCQVLAVDNLDVLCGIQKWEEKFYQIINSSKNEGSKLIFTLSENPSYLDCRLADFQSRLSWGLLLQLQLTGDTDIGDVIKLRAGLLGIELSKEVIAYLLVHYSRQLSTQIEILRVLDRASLSAQKKITIPLIKQTLADYPSLGPDTQIP
jgi:DnaA family protein